MYNIELLITNVVLFCKLCIIKAIQTLATTLMRYFGSIILFFFLVIGFVSFIFLGPCCQNIQGSKRTEMGDTAVLRMEFF